MSHGPVMSAVLCRLFYMVVLPNSRTWPLAILVRRNMFFRDTIWGLETPRRSGGGNRRTFGPSAEGARLDRSLTLHRRDLAKHETRNLVHSSQTAY